MGPFARLGIFIFAVAFSAPVFAKKDTFLDFLRGRFPNLTADELKQIVYHSKQINMSFGVAFPLHVLRFSFELDEKQHLVFWPSLTGLLQNENPIILAQDKFQPSAASLQYEGRIVGHSDSGLIRVQFEDEQQRQISVPVRHTPAGIGGGMFAMVNGKKKWLSFFYPNDAFVQGFNQLWSSKLPPIDEVKMTPELDEDSAAELRRLLGQTEKLLPLQLQAGPCLEAVERIHRSQLIKR